MNTTSKFLNHIYRSRLFIQQHLNLCNEAISLARLNLSSLCVLLCRKCNFFCFIPLPTNKNTRPSNLHKQLHGHRKTVTIFLKPRDCQASTIRHNYNTHQKTVTHVAPPAMRASSVRWGVTPSTMLDSACSTSSRIKLLLSPAFASNCFVTMSKSWK